MILQYKEQPEIRQFNSLVMPDVDYFKFNDLVDSVIIPDNKQDICRIQVIFKGGTIDDSKDFLSRTTAFTMNQGSELLSGAEIAEKLDFCGTNFVRTVQNRHTVFDLITLTRLKDRTLPILEQILKYPTFPTDKLDIVKKNVASDFEARIKKPKALAEITFRNKFYGNNNALGRIPCEQNILSIGRDDVLSYYANYYRNGNVRIVLTGNVSDDIITQICTIFDGNWFNINSERPENINITIPTVNNQTTIVNKDNALQSSIITGMHTIGRSHNDFIALRIVAMLLGGYFGSRLMQNIREEKGYTYGISARLTSTEDVGCFKISTDCDLSYTYNVLSEIRREILRLQSEPVGEDELNTLKSTMMSDMAKMVDSPFDIADYMVSQYCMQIPKDYFNNQANEVQEITSERIMEIAGRYLNPDNLFTVIASDENKLKKIPFEY